MLVVGCVVLVGQLDVGRGSHDSRCFNASGVVVKVAMPVDVAS